MSTPVLPVIVRGPGVIIRDSYAWYFKDKATIKIARGSFDIPDANYGRIDMRSTGGPTVDIDFTPTGMITAQGDFAKAYPYGPSSMVASSSINTSIYGASNKTCIIHTRAGQIITYARSAIYKSPSLFLDPRRTVFGPMTIRCMNKIDVQPTTAGVLKAYSTGAFSDTSFNSSNVVTDIYTATLGSRSAPYDAMGARTGFEIEPVYSMADISDNNFGIVDSYLETMMWKVRFAPNNLTDQQFEQLCQFQGSDAILAGQSLARGPGGTPEDLVIDSDWLTVTVHRVGVQTAEQALGNDDRNQMIEFWQNMPFTAGVAQPLITITKN